MDTNDDKNTAQEEEKELLMIIKIAKGGKMQVGFPLMHDKIMTYGVLKAAEKTLDKYYAEKDKQRIIAPSSGIMNFARKRFK